MTSGECGTAMSKLQRSVIVPSLGRLSLSSLTRPLTVSTGGAPSDSGADDADTEPEEGMDVEEPLVTPVNPPTEPPTEPPYRALLSENPATEPPYRAISKQRTEQEPPTGPPTKPPTEKPKEKEPLPEIVKKALNPDEESYWKTREGKIYRPPPPEGTEPQTLGFHDLEENIKNARKKIYPLIEYRKETLELTETLEIVDAYHTRMVKLVADQTTKVEQMTTDSEDLKNTFAAKAEIDAITQKQRVHKMSEAAAGGKTDVEKATRKEWLKVKDALLAEKRVAEANKKSAKDAFDAFIKPEKDKLAEYRANAATANQTTELLKTEKAILMEKIKLLTSKEEIAADKKLAGVVKKLMNDQIVLLENIEKQKIKDAENEAKMVLKDAAREERAEERRVAKVQADADKKAAAVAAKALLLKNFHKQLCDSALCSIHQFWEQMLALGKQATALNEELKKRECEIDEDDKVWIALLFKYAMDAQNEFAQLIAENPDVWRVENHKTIIGDKEKCPPERYGNEKETKRGKNDDEYDGEGEDLTAEEADFFVDKLEASSDRFGPQRDYTPEETRLMVLKAMTGDDDDDKFTEEKKRRQPPPEEPKRKQTTKQRIQPTKM